MHYLADHFFPLAAKTSNPSFPLFFILDRHAPVVLSYYLKSGICVRNLYRHLPASLHVDVFLHYRKHKENRWRIIPAIFLILLGWNKTLVTTKTARERVIRKKDILGGWSGTGIHPNNRRKCLLKIQHPDLPKVLQPTSSPQRPISSHTTYTPSTTSIIFHNCTFYKQASISFTVSYQVFSIDFGSC